MLDNKILDIIGIVDGDNQRQNDIIDNLFNCLDGNGKKAFEMQNINSWLLLNLDYLNTKSLFKDLQSKEIDYDYLYLLDDILNEIFQVFKVLLNNSCDCDSSIDYAKLVFIKLSQELKDQGVHSEISLFGKVSLSGENTKLIDLYKVLI